MYKYNTKAKLFKWNMLTICEEFVYLFRSAGLDVSEAAVVDVLPNAA